MHQVHTPIGSASIIHSWERLRSVVPTGSTSGRTLRRRGRGNRSGSMNFQQLRIIRETVRRHFNLTEAANADYWSPPADDIVEAAVPLDVRAEGVQPPSDSIPRVWVRPAGVRTVAPGSW